MSALHWAVDGGHEGIVHYALSEGVKVHVCFEHLHLYTQREFVYVLFLQANDVSENTIGSYTPLLKAGW